MQLLQLQQPYAKVTRITFIKVVPLLASLFNTGHMQKHLSAQGAVLPAV